MADAPKDENRVPTLLGVSNQTATIDGKDYVQDETPVPIAVNPVTGAIIVEAP
jgi:hypothetical protein